MSFDISLVPLSGAILVFRRRMRQRNAIQDLAAAFVVFACVLGLAAWLQIYWVKLGFYDSNEESLLSRLFLLSLLSQAFVVPICAAFAGATAAPERAEFVDTQSALLSRLTGFEICLGRLLASLWIIIAAVLLSLAFWLTAQLGWKFAPLEWGAFTVQLFAAHLLALLAALAFGSMSLLIAINRRPGRNILRGTFWASGAAILCYGGLFLVEPLIKKMSAPRFLIELTLLVNPIAAVSTLKGMDILRTNWVYDQTSAPEYLFYYPAPLWSGVVFVSVAVLVLHLAAYRLRVAYR